ncbi:hypothetical protein Tco_1202382 [Tanacetum coccineum]
MPIISQQQLRLKDLFRWWDLLHVFNCIECGLSRKILDCLTRPQCRNFLTIILQLIRPTVFVASVGVFVRWHLLSNNALWKEEESEANCSKKQAAKERFGRFPFCDDDD